MDVVYITPPNRPRHGEGVRPMSGTIPSELTISEIARRVDVPVHRVEYIIRTRSVRPVRVAGNCRIFTDQDVDRIAAELRRIDAERGVALCNQ